MDRHELPDLRGRMKPHKTLGVSQNASEEEIRGAFRNLAKLYHPDASGRQGSSEKFSRVAQAYKTLKSREKKEHLINFPVKNTSRSFSSYYTGTGTGTGTPQDVFKLGRLLLFNVDPGLRAFAAVRLGNSGKRSSYAFLRKAFADKNELVLKSVVKAIGTLNIYQSAGELGSLFLRSGIDLKETILDTISGFGSRKGFKNILIMAMKDQDAAIRKKALHIFAVPGG